MFRPAQLAKAMLAVAGGAIFCAVAYMMGTGKYLSSPVLWALIPLSIATAAAHRRPRLIALLYLAVVLLAFGSESVLETRLFRADLEKAFAIRNYVMERRRIEEFLATHGTDTGYARLSVPQQQDAQGNFLGLTLPDGKVVMPFLYQPGTTNLACKERGEWDLLYADRYGFRRRLRHRRGMRRRRGAHRHQTAPRLSALAKSQRPRDRRLVPQRRDC